MSMPQARTVAENIQAVVELEEGRARARGLSERIADAIGELDQKLPEGA